MTNEVQPAAANAVAAFSGIDVSQFEEHLTRDDVSIPFLQILQQLSPQCVEGDPGYIENAKASMFYNTVTGEMTESRQKGFDFVPVSYKATYIEWVPRNKGGGFIKEWPLEQGMQIKTARDEQNRDIIQSGSPFGTPGNQLNMTHTHFVFKLKDGGYEPVVLSMTSTQLKASKDLNAMVHNNMVEVGAGKYARVRFGNVFNAKTLQRKNDQGIWYVWDFERTGEVSKLLADGPTIIREASEFSKGVSAGAHKADFDKSESSNPNPSTAGGVATDEEVPF